MGQPLFFNVSTYGKIVAVPIFYLSAFILSTTLIVNAHAAGIGELMEISRAQADAQKAYGEETKAFERVKAAIQNKEITKGQAKKDVSERYGQPVVNTQEFETGREKWIYKPAKSSFFSGPKACLYFDKNDKLDEIKITE